MARLYSASSEESAVHSNALSLVRASEIKAYEAEGEVTS